MMKISLVFMLKNDPNRAKPVRFEPILGLVQVILIRNIISGSVEFLG
jgi:hypothetical protein